MNRLNLLVISKEAWGDVRWARKQWLPYFLAQRDDVEQVIYLDRHCGWWRGEMPHAPFQAGKVEVQQQSLLLPFERFPAIRNFNRRRIAGKISERVGAAGSWAALFYHPFDLELVKALKPKPKIIFDWTEDWGAFHDDASIGRLQRDCVEQADIVWTVTETLRQRALAWRGSDECVFHLPNATALEAPSATDDENSILSAIPHPRIGFVGHAGPWFDEKLVLELVHRKPEWHWVMVGGAGEAAKTALDGKSNVHWLGVFPPDRLSALMRQCDLLVSPYRKGIQGDATKLYDYLVAARPVVSTSCETAMNLQPYVEICDDVEGWIKRLEHHLRDAELSDVVPPAVLQQHHWRARADKAVKILRDQCGG